MYQTTTSSLTGSFISVPTETEFNRLITRLQLISQDLYSSVSNNSGLIEKIKLDQELTSKGEANKETEPSDILGKLFKVADELERSIQRLQNNNSKLQGLV